MFYRDSGFTGLFMQDGRLYEGGRYYLVPGHIVSEVLCPNGHLMEGAGDGTPTQAHVCRVAGCDFLGIKYRVNWPMVTLTAVTDARLPETADMPDDMPVGRGDVWCLRDALAQALGWTEGDEDYQSVPPEPRYLEARAICERYGLTLYRYTFHNGRGIFFVRDRRGVQFPVVKGDGRYLIFYLVGEPPDLIGHVTYLDAGADVFVEGLKNTNRLSAIIDLNERGTPDGDEAVADAVRSNPAVVVAVATDAINRRGEL